MSKPTEYRDATFSRETYLELVGLADWFRKRTPMNDPALIALDDVIARWEANDATEFWTDDV